MDTAHDSTARLQQATHDTAVLRCGRLSWGLLVLELAGTMCCGSAGSLSGLVQILKNGFLNMAPPDVCLPEGSAWKCSRTARILKTAALRPA